MGPDTGATVRALLVQRDVFSQDIYDQTLQLALTEWDRSLNEILQKNAAIANDVAGANR